MQKLTCLGLMVCLAGCAPAILHRHSTVQESGACTVEETAYDNVPARERVASGESSERASRSSRWIYNARGQLVQREYQPEIDSQATMWFRRDAQGRLLATDFTYDRGSRDFPCAREGGCYEAPIHLRGRMELRYDSAGRLVERIEQRSSGNNRVRSFEYDAQGRLVAVHENGVERYQYEQGPLPTWRVWEFSHGRGRMRFSYRPDGQLLERRTMMCAEICGEDVIERYQYDEHSRMIRIDALAYRSATTWSYDSAGRVISRGNEQGERTRYTYDEQGKLMSMLLDGRVMREYRYQGACANVHGPVEQPQVDFDVRLMTREQRLLPSLP